MATQSDAPPNSIDQKPQNPVSQVTQPTVDDGQNAKVEPKRESSPSSAFVNSEPIREGQVQNAVKFLSHPNVRGSPVTYRRSFLERKGLTKEEIDEAFRRVRDPTPAVTTTQQVATSHDAHVKAPSNIQQQAPIQTLQSTPAGSISTIGRLSRFHWSHALLGVGFLAVSGAGTAVLFKNAIFPRLKSWIRKVVLEEEEEGLQKKYEVKPSLAEEAAAAAKAAAAAAADVARTSQEILISKTEEKRCFEELISVINVQLGEMKLMSTAMRKLEGRNQGRIPMEEQDDNRISWTSSRQPYANGKVDSDSRSVRSSSPPALVEPSVAPHPKSYMEIMAMIQRGEKPSNIREINDAPPNPNQPVPLPRLAPRPKPWEVSQAQRTSTNVIQSQESSNGVSYEFKDKQANGDDEVPWWQRKNVRITEIEAGDEQKFGSSNITSHVGPVQRLWVPPQPPPVAMPEAAAAIRQPKKLQKDDQLNDEQSMARSSDVTDELQRFTKLSELGGSVEVNGGNSGYNSSEIQKEEENSILEM
ncbi:peroxisomal membrane PEX14-like isoform X1 [Olea europaea subsp. europaea]|uniref:Peroxisomal membrane protein PEX14 n=1 Tax=Olea europaea subsp. europaea TaxID=158383 RepID=A0A8S0PQ97_OLEEU|nr:peroxisomal membrane PEX14-like isoform X1 [Olea europaea subsp. europaea]